MYTSTVDKCSLQQSKYVTFILGHNYANENRDEEVNNPPRPHENSLIINKQSTNENINK